MKTLISLFVTLLITLSGFAQQGINYKAIIKDGSGNVIANDLIAVQFEIREETSTGTVVFTETHTPTTDANGLVILTIGSIGTGFDTIDWGSDSHFLNVQVDIGGGLVDLNTTEFNAVPYAFKADSATFSTVNNVTSNSPGNLVADNLVFGSTQMDDDNTTPDDNARLFFNKAKGAFRAGLVDDTYWDNSEVGSYSVSMGLNTKALGQNSFAMGGNSTAIGKDAVAMGGIATATGQNAISIGNQTNANGLTSVALGAGTISNGFYSTAMNLSTTADALASTAMGRNNIGTGDPANWIETDPLFEIGNSIDSNNKSNALTILKNGTITAPSFDLTEITDDKALITKEYLDTNGSTGLEALDEGNGTGWRLVGRNPNDYENIGDGAVDLSYSSLGANLGATGNYSFAMGTDTTASGDFSTAMGGVTTAYEDFSTAMGHSTIASGVVSTAMGSVTTASGDASTAMGRSTSARSAYETTIGSYNTDYTPISDTSFNENDRLFVIGNGSSNSNRNNALTVLKNGNIGIGRSNPASLLEVGHGNTAPTSADRTDAFSIRNLNNSRSWQFHTASSGYLLLFNDGNYRGSWNSTSGAYVQASDRRVKKDITPLDNGTLDKVMQLNPVSYLMKDQTDTNRNLGLISQEVQEIFPSITHYVKESDLLTLSYTELIPILIKALQEQQGIIEAQNSKIEAQNTKNTDQDKTITALLNRMDQLESASNR